MNTVELTVNDYKAISKADIALDGITVLSGINGSGKSSLSKLLYYAFKYANAFESIPSMEMDELLDIYRTVHSWRYEPYFRDLLKEKDISSVRAENTLEGRKNFFVGLLRRYIECVNQNKAPKSSTNEERIKMILSDLLKKKQKDESVADLLVALVKRIEELNEGIAKRNLMRPYNVYRNKLELLLESSLLEVQIKEYDVPFVGKGVTSVPVLHSIQNVVYIDTPMIVGGNFLIDEPEYWEDLQSFLEKPRQRSYSKTIFHILRDEIMHGDSGKGDDTFYSSLRYNREDGQSFPLFDSATGIKSFAVLQLLLRNGVINKNTLLIIDEPEAHLHPQWIVEYARIVVFRKHHLHRIR